MWELECGVMGIDVLHTVRRSFFDLRDLLFDDCIYLLLAI